MLKNSGHLELSTAETLDSTDPSTDIDISYAKPGNVVVVGVGPSASPAYQGVAQVQISLDGTNFVNAPGTSAFTNAAFVYELTCPAKRVRTYLSTATAGSLITLVGVWDERY